VAEATFVVRHGRDRRRKRRGAKPERRATGRDRRRGQHSFSGTARLGLTVSIGLCAAAGSERPQEALLRADAALYQAKKSGRNRLVTSS
jgi:PleD family two-component response regulator